MQKTAVQDLIACQLLIQNILQSQRNKTGRRSWKEGECIGRTSVDVLGDVEKQECQSVNSAECETRSSNHISSQIYRSREKTKVDGFMDPVRWFYISDWK